MSPTIPRTEALTAERPIAKRFAGTGRASADGCGPPIGLAVRDVTFGRSGRPRAANAARECRGPSTEGRVRRELREPSSRCRREVRRTSALLDIANRQPSRGERFTVTAAPDNRSVVVHRRPIPRRTFPPPGRRALDFASVLPETGVTLYSGDMGDTLPPRRGHALEGVSRGRRASSLHRPLARWREDGPSVRRVRDFPQDGLQDLRSLQGLRRRGADRPQSTAVPLREPAAAGRGAGHPAPQADVSDVGRRQDPRAAPGRAARAPVSRRQHRARRARSAWAGDAAPSAALSGRGDGAVAADPAQ